MTKPKLSYFDAPVSRGEECRLAFAVAGVDFEDHRIPFAEWPTVKPTTPFGVVPVLTLPDGTVIPDSNAILVYIGRTTGLHPSDPVEAALHEALMAHVELVRAKVSPTLRMGDEQKKAAREELVKSFFPEWGAQTEKFLAGHGEGPFFAGAKLHVVDLKLHMIVRWFAGGKVDHIPADVFAAFPRLMRLYDAVRAHDAVARRL